MIFLEPKKKTMPTEMSVYETTLTYMGLGITTRPVVDFPRAYTMLRPDKRLL